MMLKPQDVVVAVYLALLGDEDWTYAGLAEGLRISSSEVHSAVKRALAAKLLWKEGRAVKKQNLREFLIHGLKYAFSAEEGGLARGIPTSYGAPALSSFFEMGELPPVWPDKNGTVRGVSVEPVHKSVPIVSRENPEFYRVFALVDALRIGRARESRLAQRELEKVFA